MRSQEFSPLNGAPGRFASLRAVELLVNEEFKALAVKAARWERRGTSCMKRGFS